MKTNDLIAKDQRLKLNQLKEELPKGEDIEASLEDKETVESDTKSEPITMTFVKVNTLDIDTFEIIEDVKTFNTEGNRVGFVRKVIFQDYTGDQTVVFRRFLYNKKHHRHIWCFFIFPLYNYYVKKINMKDGKLMTTENLKVVLFASRSKDNKNVPGFKERLESFITSKESSDQFLIDSFENFNKRGVDCETSRFYISVNLRDPLKINRAFSIYLFSKIDYISPASYPQRAASIAARLENVL